MAQAFAAAGHETHVLMGDPKLAAQGPGVRPGVTFHAIDWDDPVVKLDAYPCHPARHSMGVYQRLKQLHAQHGFDYIEFPDFRGEGYFTVRAKRTLGQFENAVLGVRLHLMVRDIREINGEVWIDREPAVAGHMETEGVRLADLISAPSRAMYELARARIGGDLDESARPVLIVPNPFSMDLLSELGWKPVAGVDKPPSPATPTVLFTGRLEYRKGVHLLVEAAQRLLRRGVIANFRFIGADSDTGPMCFSMLDHLRRSIDPRFRDRFVFEGTFERARLGEAITSATVCCFPSVWENFPYACLEAMALGAAVVGSDAGGMAEMIEHERSGLLVKGGCVESLEAALTRLLADAPLRGTLARNAPLRVRSLCEPGRIVAEVERRVREVAGAGSARRASVAAGSGGAVGQPEVSIIIPVFNLHAYVEDTLRSVAAQTCGAIEAIVIDDGSSDPATIAELARLARDPSFAFARFMRIEHAGLSAARNAGIECAKGRWVLPLDCDDQIAPTFVEKCLGAAARDHGLTFITTLLTCYAQIPGAPTGGWMPLGSDAELLSVINVASSCVALIDRNAVLAAGGFDPWMPAYEDWDLFCSLVERGGRGTVIPEFLILNRVRPDSMMRSLSRRQHEVLRAKIISKHPTLSPDPGRTLRLMMGDLVPWKSLEDGTARMDPHADPRAYHNADPNLDPQVLARRIVDENPRYQVADRVNAFLKATPVHAALKSLTKRALRKE